MAGKLELAEEHGRALCFLIEAGGTEHPRWIQTVACYVAIPLVDRAIEQCGVNCPGDHRDRNGALQRTNKLKGIHDSYAPMYRASKAARYYPTSSGSSEDAIRQLVRGRLIPLLKSAKKHSGEEEKRIDALMSSIIAACKSALES
ncbi:MAG: hypothetical protein AAFU73_05295 [Planctomycetota bacterium]